MKYLDLVTKFNAKPDENNSFLAVKQTYEIIISDFKQKWIVFKSISSKIKECKQLL